MGGVPVSRENLLVVMRLSVMEACHLVRTAEWPRRTCPPSHAEKLYGESLRKSVWG